jgi:hypothetical protein
VYSYLESQKADALYIGSLIESSPAIGCFAVNGGKRGAETREAAATGTGTDHRSRRREADRQLSWHQ